MQQFKVLQRPFVRLKMHALQALSYASQRVIRSIASAISAADPA